MLISELTTRLAWFVPVLLGVSVLSFALLIVIPGDPVLNFVGERAAPETVAQIRAAWGLDKPLVAQYMVFMGRLIRGDFGASYRTGRDVISQILTALANTLQLAVVALFIGIVSGIGLGILAVFLGPFGRKLVLYLSLFVLGIPVYLWALFILYLFAIHWQLLPVGGQGSWRHFILPALSLGLRQGAVVSRYTYLGLCQVLRADYILVARAKGLSLPRVVIKHGLRNALLPIITVIGMDFASYLNGSVLTETIFGWPGLGRLTVDALISRDFPVIQGIVLVSSLVFLIINLIVDVSYLYLDPRLRYI